MLHDEEIRKILSRAKGVARQRGKHQDADDFAQFCVMKIIGGRKATYKQLWVDFSIKHFRLSLHNREQLYGETVEEIEASPSKVNFAVYYHAVQKNLNSFERGIFNLYIAEDRTAADIGKIFGLTESRISQILTAIYKIISSVDSGDSTKI